MLFSSFLFLNKLGPSEGTGYGIKLLIFGAMRGFEEGGVKEGAGRCIYNDSCVCFAQNMFSSYARLSPVSTFFSFVLTTSLYFSAVPVQFSVRDVLHVLVLSGSFCCHRFLLP